MKFKFVFLYFIVIIFITVLGLYFSLKGSVLYEGADNKESISFIGKVLLWPYWVWSLISHKIFLGKEYFSYLSLFLSQVVGYSLLMLFANKIRKAINNLIKVNDLDP